MRAPGPGMAELHAATPRGPSRQGRPPCASCARPTPQPLGGAAADLAAGAGCAAAAGPEQEGAERGADAGRRLLGRAGGGHPGEQAPGRAARPASRRTAIGAASSSRGSRGGGRWAAQQGQGRGAAQQGQGQAGGSAGAGAGGRLSSRRAGSCMAPPPLSPPTYYPHPPPLSTLHTPRPCCLQFARADARRANLRDLDATDANCYGTDFAGADLRGATFDNAILTGAKFGRDTESGNWANLEGTRWVARRWRMQC